MSLAGLLLISACSKDKPVREEPRAPAAGMEPAAEPEGPPRASYADETFEVTLSATGPYEVGKPGKAEVRLLARGAFKCNDEYPYKLKLDKSDGLEFPAQIVGKDAVVLETKQAVMSVPFTPKVKGSQVLSGEFSFSVCTDEKCLIEKRKLALQLDVQ